MKQRKTGQQLPTVEELEKELTRETYRRNYWRTLQSTLAILIVAAAAAVLAAVFVFPVLRIYGQSMTPGLADGDIVVTVRTAEPDSGDVTALYYNNKILVKRVIAGPGDWVNIEENGDVYVNQQLLEEPYLSEKALGDCDLEFPCQVPDGHFFVLGDHRELSADSRNADVGFIAQDQLAGKLVFRIWPFSKLGPIH